MNKLVSTLLCGAFALVSVSAQDVAPKFFKLKTANAGEYLVLLQKDGKDSTVVSTDATLIDSNAALWSVTRSDRQVSGNYAYEFANKVSSKLTVDKQVVFAVGTYSAVLNELDTVGGVNQVAKKLFYAKDNAGVLLKVNAANNNVINSVTGTDLEVILEIPGKRWLTSADLNENTEYTFDFLSSFEGTDNTFLFNVAPGHDTDNSVFNIVSKESGKAFSVDSANWTKSSSVNIANQQPAFGFKLGFNKSPFTNFGLYYDPATDKVAVAVRDSSLGWDVVAKVLGANVNTAAAGDDNAAAFIGYATFVKDSVVTTVDATTFTYPTLPTPENGIVFWVDAPQKGKAIATPFGENPYVLSVVSKDAAKNGEILAVKYVDLTTNGGRAYLPKATSTVEPENQWYIQENVKSGKYYYTVVNRYYTDTLVTDARITKIGDAYLFGTDTVKVAEVTNPAGFKVFTDYEIAAQKVQLNIVNSLGAAGATLVLKDSLVVAGEKNGIAFNVKVADGYAKQDSFPYYVAPGKLLNAKDVYAVYTLFTTAGADTLFLGFDNVEEKLVLSKFASKSAFVFKSDTEEAYKLLPITSVINGDSTLRVHENAAYTEKIDYHNTLASLFKVSPTAPKYEYASLAAGHYTFLDHSATATGLDYLTKKENGVAKFLRIGDDLRATSTAADFALWVDSANVPATGVESLTPSYYILKGAERFANADSLKGNFLTVTKPYDTLNDSINFVAGKAAVNNVKVKKESAFLFRLTDTESVYEIVPYNELMNQTPRILALINGVVVASADKTALPILVKAATELPVGNENINATEVKVVAGDGNVVIFNAAGKKVVVNNILGQVVANAVLSSDQVTLTVPKGIVVVAVEGENAVKAIVK